MTGRPSGLAGLDARLGGFLVGDNIILENDVSAPADAALDAFVRGAIARQERVHFLTFDASPRALHQRIPSLQHASVIDCFSRGLGDPSAPTSPPKGCTVVAQPEVPEEVLHVVDRLAEADPTAFLVVDSLNGMARLWGDEELPALFYARVCPRLFDAGNLALWVLHQGIQTDRFHAAIGHVAQVVLAFTRGPQGLSLEIRRATGRPEASVGLPLPCVLRGGTLRVDA